MNGTSTIELDRLNNSPYKDLYIPPVPEPGKPPVKPRAFRTIFFKDFSNTIWHATNTITLGGSNPVEAKHELYGTQKNALVITYDVPENIDILIETTCVMNTPKAWIKKAFEGKARIRWGLNLGPSGIYATTFKSGDTFLDGFSGGWMKTFYNWAISQSESECVSESIGNVPELTDWSMTSIDAKELRFTIPYFYGYPEDRLSGAFPIFLLGEKGKLTKTLTIPAKFTESLLQVELSNDGKVWKPAPAKYFNDIVAIGEHGHPVLSLYYGMLTQDEKESYYFGEDEKGNTFEHLKHVYPIHHVIEIKAHNVTKPGMNAAVPINTGPALAFFANGVNLDSVANKETSNYTTNAENPKEGVSSIAKVDFFYDKTLRLTLTPSMMKQMETLRHVPGKPKLPGAFFGAITHRPFRTHGMVGEVPDKTTPDMLVCTYTGITGKKEEIEETVDPSELIDRVMSNDLSSLRLEKHEHSSTNGYATEVFVLVHRNLEFARISNDKVPVYSVKTH